MKPDTNTRVGRMVEGLLEAAPNKGKLSLTVSVFDGTERRLHQAFRMKSWDGRSGRMVTLDLNDGNWSEGRFPTKVLHVDIASGKAFPAKGQDDQLLLYAARAAVQYAFEGTTPTPGNGRVEVVEAEMCGMCGSTLTHPDSIERGIGPECYGKATKGKTIVAERQLSLVVDASEAELYELCRQSQESMADSQVDGTTDALEALTKAIEDARAAVRAKMEQRS